MSDKAPLVRGGHMMDPERASGNDDIFSYTTAFFHPRAYILAAVSTTTHQSAPSAEGWFVSDFFALNAVLRGVGSDQTWLTVADIDEIIQRHGELLHGNPFREPRVVLSRELLESGRITLPTRVPLGHLTAEFLRRAGELSIKAWREGVPLILCLFCHGDGDGTPTYELKLDGVNAQGLRPLQLKGVLEPGAKVVVVTTACYSGGWMINDFNRTMATAAAHDSVSTSWPLAEPVGMASSVFISALIQTLTSTTSPLLRERYEGQQTEISLQPDAPTRDQILTYNVFCRSVWELYQDITRMWDQHEFAFSCENDRWDLSWSAAVGIPFDAYGEKWQDLPIKRYEGHPSLLDQDPRNDEISEATAGTVASGSATAEKIRSKLREHLSDRDTKALADVFANHTCPGDWYCGQNGAYLGVLLSCAKGERDGKLETIEDPLSDEYSPMDEFDVYASILYRWEAANFVEFLLRKFNLPKPKGQDCLFWDMGKWFSELFHNREAKLVDSEVQARLWLGGFPRETTLAQGPDFTRPLRYLTAAIIEAKLEPHERSTVVDEILALVQGVRKSELAKLVARVSQSLGLRGPANNWLRTLGKEVASTDPNVR